MATYKYTDATNQVVHVIDDDGISRSSCLASTLSEGSVIEPADPVVQPDPTTLPANINQYEWENVNNAVLLMQETIGLLTTRIATLEKKPK